MLGLASYDLGAISCDNTELEDRNETPMTSRYMLTQLCGEMIGACFAEHDLTVLSLCLLISRFLLLASILC